MTTYLITFFIVFVCCYFAEKSNIKSKALLGSNYASNKSFDTLFFLFIAIFTLTFVSGFRHYVGADYGTYITIYRSLSNSKVDFFDITNENGFALLCRFCNIAFGNYISMFIMVAIITIVPYLYSTYKENGDFLFVTILYVFTGRWHGSFNGIRQYIAVTIIYCGRHYITQHKFLKYLLVCFIAFLFHRSAIFALLFYFIYSDNFSIKRLLVIGICAFLISINYEIIFSFIGWIDNKEFIANDYSTKAVNTLRVIVHCCPAVLAIYLAINKKIQSCNVFYVYMFVANAVVYIAMSNSAYLTRLGIYTSAFIPLGLSYITQSIAKKHYKVIRYLIVIFYFLFWFYEVSKNANLSNFRWAFNYI